ncbi:hypothetical protein [Kitasatospora sp. NPDC004289]
MTTELDPDADDAEYRLAAVSMSHVRPAMNEAGMLMAVEPPTFPHPADFGITLEDEVRQYRAGLGAPRSEAFLALDRATRAVQDHTVESPTGIASYKIGGTNDGWLVSPAEIRAALAVHDGLDDDTRERLFGGLESWIDYLRLAAGRGGFRVE